MPDGPRYLGNPEGFHPILRCPWCWSWVVSTWRQKHWWCKCGYGEPFLKDMIWLKWMQSDWREYKRSLRSTDV